MSWSCKLNDGAEMLQCEGRFLLTQLSLIVRWKATPPKCNSRYTWYESQLIWYVLIFAGHTSDTVNLDCSSFSMACRSATWLAEAFAWFFKLSCALAKSASDTCSRLCYETKDHLFHLFATRERFLTPRQFHDSDWANGGLHIWEIYKHKDNDNDPWFSWVSCLLNLRSDIYQPAHRHFSVTPKLDKGNSWLKILYSQ